MTSPGSVTGPVTDTKHYDDDGNVTSVVVVSNIGLLSDSMTYDNMGRVETGHFSGSGVSTNPTEDVTMMYHGLGSVIGMETNASGSVATEAFTVDALGNRLNSWRLPMSYNAADPNTARVMDVSANGELMTVTSPKNDSTYATYPYFYRQGAGLRRRGQSLDSVHEGAERLRNWRRDHDELSDELSDECASGTGSDIIVYGGQHDGTIRSRRRELQLIL